MVLPLSPKFRPGTQYTKKGVYLLPGITPEPEILTRYTVHKKKGVYLLPGITPEPKIQARYTVHKKKVCI